jgi:hypothetical protein
LQADRRQSSLSGIVLPAKGKSMEVDAIAHIFLTAGVAAMAIPFCGKYAKAMAPARWPHPSAACRCGPLAA